MDQPEDVTLSLSAGFALSGIRVAQLWVDQIGLGGSLTQGEVAAALLGTRQLTSYEHDLLAQALNERLTDQGYPDHRVGYSRRT